MSVINQTLRQLDARKDAAPAPRPVQVSTPAPARGVAAALWGLAAALLVVAGVLLWLFPQPAEVAPPVEAVPRVADAPVLDGAVPATAERAPVEPAIEAPAAPPAETMPSPTNPPPSAQAHVPVAAAATVPGPQAEVDAAPGNAAPTEPAAPPAIRKNARVPSAEETAEADYRKAVVQVRAGRDAQARPWLVAALQAYPRHVAARQMLATLLSEAGQNREAEALLSEGRELMPDEAWFALAQARLQVARGDTAGAAASLLGGQSGRGVDADYRATLAALLVNLGRHAEAARQYELALELQPGQGTWWMGLGLALEAQGRNSDAREAYRRALAAGNLPETFQTFVRKKNAE